MPLIAKAKLLKSRAITILVPPPNHQQFLKKPLNLLIFQRLMELTPVAVGWNLTSLFG